MSPVLGTTAATTLRASRYRRARSTNSSDLFNGDLSTNTLRRLTLVRTPPQNAGSSWLFPGRRPGIPLTEDVLAQRLHALGISQRQSRDTAVFTLAADVPAAILARTLGIHIKATTQWQKISGGDWAAYAAEVGSRPEH